MDYKEMYLKMVRASEDAIRTLIKAQQECEEMYLTQPSRTRAKTEKQIGSPICFLIKLHICKKTAA